MMQAIGEGSAMERNLPNGSACASDTASASVSANTQDRKRDRILERLVSSCTILRFLFVAVFACVAIATVLYASAPLWNQWTPVRWLSYTENGDAHMPLAAEWVRGSSTLIMVSLLLWRVQRMLQFIADEKSPFRPQVYSALKFAARMLILLPILPMALTSATVWLCLQLGYQGGAAVTSWVGLDAICVGIILHVVANVFEYGCLLQTQDDGLI